MRNLGATLLGLGILSYVLPLIGMQFQLIQLLGDTPGVRIGMIVVGAVLLFFGRDTEQETTPAEEAPPATVNDDSLQIEQVHSPAHTPHAGSGSQHFCAHCGHHVAGTEKFCGNCGRPVEAPRAAGRRCPNPGCGHVIPPGKRFCTRCGGRVAAKT